MLYTTNCSIKLRDLLLISDGGFRKRFKLDERQKRKGYYKLFPFIILVDSTNIPICICYISAL